MNGVALACSGIEKSNQPGPRSSLESQRVARPVKLYDIDYILGAALNGPPIFMIIKAQCTSNWNCKVR